MLPISDTGFFHDIHFLQSIASSIQEGVIILDQRGTIVSFNEQAKNILNLHKDQLLDRSPTQSLWNAVHLDGSIVHSHELPVSITLKTGNPQNNVILGVVAADNPLKWLSVNSRMIKTTDDEVFVFATFIDVTKLILSNQSLYDEQEKLKASEEKFSQSFRYSSIGMAIVSPGGDLRDVNESFCKMLGYTREQLLQRSFQDITYPEDLEKDLSLVQKMLEKEIETYQLEKRYIHKSGNVVWALLSVSLVLNSAGEPQFFISQVQEITEQKKLNRWLEDRNVELLKTQTALKRKISQLKDFAGIITHDVRGPAGNIKRMLELYETSADTETKDTAFNYLKKISSDLTSNLNELVHVLQIHLEKDIPHSDCDFSAITSSVCLQLQDSINQKHARIITDFALPSISYPKIYLQSILYNLISNSLKYTREGVPPVIRVASFSKDNYSYLSVSDNGLGLDMKKFGKSLFQFQKSFHSGYDSKGIGLYLVRNQVEDLGGSITAESEVGKGISFTIRF
ncbi:MAG: PAS domain S-box protein [Bacteroidota bacterium]